MVLGSQKEEPRQTATKKSPSEKWDRRHVTISKKSKSSLKSLPSIFIQLTHKNTHNTECHELQKQQGTQWRGGVMRRLVGSLPREGIL